MLFRSELHWSPSIAVVTNLTPNHLDHHGTMDEYIAAKQNILRFQQPGTGDLAILPAHDAEVSRWASLTPGRVLWYDVRDGQAGAVNDSAGGDGAWREGERLLVRFDGRTESVALSEALSMPGEHNVANLMAAALAARAAGVPLAETAEATVGFKGLPHRLQLVADVGQVRYYNDSKATTPVAAEVALCSFQRDQLIAIAGGYDKKIDLSPLVEALLRHARTVLLIGDTANQLAALLEAAGHRHFEVVETLQRAVARAGELAQPGDVVLLSPGHASWDQYENYEKRGDDFRRFAMMPTTTCCTEPAE